MLMNEVAFGIILITRSVDNASPILAIPNFGARDSTTFFSRIESLIPVSVPIITGGCTASTTKYYRMEYGCFCTVKITSYSAWPVNVISHLQVKRAL